MTHAQRGLAIIFNHLNFAPETNQRARTGTNIDRNSLINTLSQLNFDVIVHNDKTKNKILDILDKVSEQDHSNADCLCIVVLSHGLEGLVFAYDEMYEIEQLWKPFTADNCPSLAGKPKWFIFQVGRYWLLIK